MPFLYLMGWLFVQPFRLLGVNISSNDLSLIGTLVTFCLFIFLLPSWVKSRWHSSKPWVALGLHAPLELRSFLFVLRGSLVAWFLIIVALATIFSGAWLQISSLINFNQFLNAILLGLGVGLAEELIFRGWLLGELIQLLGPRLAIVIQAVIFSLAHIRFQLPFDELLILLLGLFLLGLLLGIRRSLDKGSLWGVIALHGGLVGGWFLVSNGFIDISANAPVWLVGPGVLTPNPIGGVGAISTMIMIIFYQRRAFNRSLGVFTETVRASSKGDRP